MSPKIFGIRKLDSEFHQTFGIRKLE